MPGFVEIDRPDSIPALVARVIDRHHTFLRRNLPDVSVLVDTIAEVHGPRVPELLELRRTVEGLRSALEQGMADEETRLFPLLMTAGGAAGLRDDLRELASRRDTITGAVERIRALTSEYRAPEGACRTWLRALIELEDLETDLSRHLALEDRLRALAAPPSA